MFYIIERLDQLEKLGDFGDCFVSFIPKSNKFHPALTDLSLVHVRDFNQSKGSMLCINNNEEFGFTITDINRKEIPEIDIFLAEYSNEG